MNEKEAYQLYVKYCVKEKTGSYPRPIQNFDKLNDGVLYPIFTKFCKLCEDSGTLLNPDVYVKSLARHYHGFFPPKSLIMPTAFRIYRKYIKSLNDVDDTQQITKLILNSCREVSSYCLTKKITNISDYFYENSMLVPTVAKHYHSGLINDYWLSCMPNVKDIIDGYPKDSKPFTKGFSYKKARDKVITIPKLRTLADNFIYVMNQSIAELSNK